MKLGSFLQVFDDEDTFHTRTPPERRTFGLDSGQLLLEDGSELRSIGSEDDSQGSSEGLVARCRGGLVAGVLAHLWSQQAATLNGARIVGG